MTLEVATRHASQQTLVLILNLTLHPQLESLVTLGIRVKDQVVSLNGKKCVNKTAEEFKKMVQKSARPMTITVQVGST